MFADVINSTELANVLTRSEYRKWVVDTLDRILTKTAAEYAPLYKKKAASLDAKWVGDEGRVFFSFPTAQAGTAVRHAFDIALKMKTRWVLSELNTARIKQNKLPIDLSIGIHCAEKVGPCSKGKGGSQGPEGYPVALAKRLETSAKDGRFFMVVVSDAIAQLARGLAAEGPKEGLGLDFGERTAITVKGVTQKIPSYELRSFFSAVQQLALTNKEVRGLRQVFRKTLSAWVGIRLLNQFLAEGKWEDVRELGLSLFRLEKSLYVVPVALAMAAQGNETDDEAIWWLEYAQRINDQAPFLYAMCAEAYATCGDSGKAIDKLRGFLALTMSDKDRAWATKGIGKLRKGATWPQGESP